MSFHPKSHYALSVVHLDRGGLRPLKKRRTLINASVAKNGGLTHIGYAQANAAAKAISMNRNVERVVVTRVTEQHERTYRKGIWK